MVEKKHFSSLHEYHQFFGLPAPEHPLFSIVSMESEDLEALSCPDVEMEVSSDFYSISLKQIYEGEIHYGRTKYDFQNGSLICVGPRQTVRASGVKTRSSAKVVLIHEDFLRGTNIQGTFEDAHYFNYAVNEALHLSPKEETLLQTIFDAIQQECLHSHDAFSKSIIVSQLKTMLTYAERFYQRQFQQRMEVQSTSLQQRFVEALKKTPSDQIPSVEKIASQLHVTPRYLSDALKVETGATALENIHHYQIERAKNLLLGSDDSVSVIAYALGFEYPQYFSRLFKKKVGMTPTDYRTQTRH